MCIEVKGCPNKVSTRWFRYSAPTNEGAQSAQATRTCLCLVTGRAGGSVTVDDSVFEADIEWPAGAGVTLGCNPPTNDNFCPDDNVKRGQMAAFMRRFAAFLGAEDGVVSNADDAATDADSALLNGLSAADIVDSSPAVINAAEFTPDGFGAFGDFSFGWFSTSWTAGTVGAGCMQAPVSVPHGASLLSAELYVLDTAGTGSYRFHSANLGDASTFAQVTGSAVADPAVQTVTIDLTGTTATSMSQHWIGWCPSTVGDSMFGARVFYTITDASLAAEPAPVKTGQAPQATTSNNR